MADTNFVDQSSTVQGTGIVAAWLNAVNKRLFWGRRPNIATTTGSANAQVLTLEAGSLYVAGSEADGDEFWLTAGFTNTGAMTLQVLAPSGANVARAVQLNGQALTGGEVQSGTLYKVQRLGTTWQLAASKQILFAGLTAQRTLTLPDANLTVPAVTAKGDSWYASASGVMARVAVGTDGQVEKAASAQAAGVQWVDNVAAIGYVIDGGGAAPSTGVKGDLLVPFACTINSVTLQADQSGSCVIDIWKKAYTLDSPPTVANTITAAALPTLSSHQSVQDTTLTGWTTSIAANDMLRFNLNSVTTCQRITLTLKVTKT